MQILKWSEAVQVQGRPMKIEISKGKKKKEEGEGEERGERDDSLTVYVGGFSAYAVDEDDLLRQFSTLCGDVKKVRISGATKKKREERKRGESEKKDAGEEEKKLLEEESGDTSGRAYVDFASSEAREKALSLSGQISLNDRPLSIEVPKPIRDRGGRDDRGDEGVGERKKKRMKADGDGDSEERVETIGRIERDGEEGHPNRKRGREEEEGEGLEGKKETVKPPVASVRSLVPPSVARMMKKRI